MRPLVHKAQAVLLLVVGGLAGAVLASAVIQRSGLPSPVMTRAAQLVAPSASKLPARIEIGSPGQSPAEGPSTGTREIGPASATAALEPTAGPSLTDGPSDQPPAGSTTVVPPTVYSYPPDDHGDKSGSGSSPGGSGSGRGGHS
jgi:hypothetical protein